MAAAAPRLFLDVERSLLGQAWRDRLDEQARARSLAISQRHDVSDLLARVMAGRGVGPDDAEAFLKPSIRTAMPDPSSLADMDKAAVRLADAVERRENVALFADYDVDGATSAAILTRALKALGLDPVIHIPDRITEGYGPNREAMARLVEGGATLIVTLDCGVTSHAILAETAARGVDVLVLDHHQADEELPTAVAVVDPNRRDDLSGLGHLCAAGVTFMAVVALNRELRRRGFFRTREEPDLMALTDCVALGTVADVVPLIGLNRAFVARGLAVMRQRRNVGLTALMDAARLDGPPTAFHLGFLLGPRINAGGRIGEAALGARLLTLEDPDEAARIAGDLDRLNRERQAVEQGTLAAAEAEALASLGIEGEGAEILVTAGEGWHVGVVGLVAARLKERFGRPAFAIGFDGETGVGSGRSIAGVDLGAAVRLAARDGLIVKGGGHAMAAGVTLARDRLGAFRAFLEERLGAASARARADRMLAIDGATTARGVTPALVASLDAAGPFGSGNPEPVLALPSHRVVEASVVGGAHVRATLAGTDGARLDAIAFRAAETALGAALLARRGDPVHIAGTAQIDRWQGREKVKFRILDAAKAERG